MISWVMAEFFTVCAKKNKNCRRSSVKPAAWKRHPLQLRSVSATTAQRPCAQPTQLHGAPPATAQYSTMGCTASTHDSAVAAYVPSQHPVLPRGESYSAKPPCASAATTRYNGKAPCPRVSLGTLTSASFHMSSSTVGGVGPSPLAREHATPTASCAVPKLEPPQISISGTAAAGTASPPPSSAQTGVCAPPPVLTMEIMQFLAAEGSRQAHAEALATLAKHGTTPAHVPLLSLPNQASSPGLSRDVGSAGSLGTAAGAFLRTGRSDIASPADGRRSALSDASEVEYFGSSSTWWAHAGSDASDDVSP